MQMIRKKAMKNFMITSNGLRKKTIQLSTLLLQKERNLKSILPCSPSYMEEVLVLPIKKSVYRGLTNGIAAKEQSVA